MPIDQNNAETAPSKSVHSIICNCKLCVISLLSDAERTKYQEAIKTTMVDRRNPDRPVRPLMKAAVAFHILTSGKTFNMVSATGLNRAYLPTRREIVMAEPREIIIAAEWKNYQQEMANSGRDASVFGAQGVLLSRMFSQGYIQIPQMNAASVPPSFLEKYGAELISLEKNITLPKSNDSSLENLYLMQYDFDADYVVEYVMHPRGGGGVFVERHPFPHVFTPLSPACSGALILGVDLGEGEFNFAAFQIPYGFSIKINSNVIHGDSYFIGPYAIALTETKLADAVLFKKCTPERDIQPMALKKIDPTINPLIAEYRLQKAVNKQILENKVGHHLSGLTFFQKSLPKILSEVQHAAPTQVALSKAAHN